MKAERMKLPQPVIDFILERFDEARDNIGCDGDMTEDDYSDEHGRCFMYMAYDDACDDLKKLMFGEGKLTARQEAKVVQVAEAFLCE